MQGKGRSSVSHRRGRKRVAHIGDEVGNVGDVPNQKQPGNGRQRLICHPLRGLSMISRASQWLSAFGFTMGGDAGANAIFDGNGYPTHRDDMSGKVMKKEKNYGIRRIFC